MRTGTASTVARLARRTGIGFVDDLATHGDAPALIDHDGRPVTYVELDQRIDDVRAALGDDRRLVVVPMPTTVDAVVSYLACLRGGHVALLTGDDAARVTSSFDADTVLDHPRGSIEHRHARPRHELHRDLALLLSTSGSTGASKLVRLSRANVDSNARAIADALDLRGGDRAITSLPLHYCYGLSVLHSHLAVGAAVVLTDASVVDACFWDAVDRHHVTTLAGVPHSFELLHHGPVALGEHPSLRLLTQAGGRLRPELVRAIARDAAALGVDFRVMYGQTEATARIAVTPPGVAAIRPDVVGRPVPGTDVRVEIDGDDAEHGTVGELIVEGPGVMMGYATSPADLARGPEVASLRTGDLGRRHPDGTIEIVGRQADFVKLFGLRIDLRQAAEILADEGIDAEVVGDDDGLAIAVRGDHDAASAREVLARRLSIPRNAIASAELEVLPRLSNGKLDRGATMQAIRQRHDATSRSAAAMPAGDVRALFSDVLGVQTVDPNDTFVSLGGDSLSYVEMSVRLEAALGHLPEAWHLTPVAELQRATRAPRRWASVETNVVIRAIAIVLILANHTGAFLIGGGAHVLLAGAGYNLARFQLSSGPPWRSIVRLALPAVAWIGAVAAVRDDFDLAHALLLHGWIGGSGRWAYWFVEVLAQLLVVTAIGLSVPAVRRLERARPFLFPAVLTAGALLVRFDLVDLGTHHRPFFRPHEVAWIFLLGWTAQRADTGARRTMATGIVLIAVPGFFGSTTRELVLACGLLALLWLPRLPLPRAVTPAAGALAGASLWIYLTHYQVHPLLSADHPLLAMALSIGAGTVAWRLLDPPLMRLADRALRLLGRVGVLARRAPEQTARGRDTVGA